MHSCDLHMFIPQGAFFVLIGSLESRCTVLRVSFFGTKYNPSNSESRSNLVADI